MGFDVVVVTRISSSWFNATGIDNGDDETDSFDGAGHSVKENLSLATGHSSDHKVWLTESAFASAHESLTIDAICSYCYGFVSDREHVRYEKIGRYEYECYFNEDSIIREFCVRGQEKTETCPDGSVVQTHVCIPPDYVATGVTCTTECKDGNTVGKTCPDGTYITLKRCVEGMWVDTGDTCPEEEEPFVCDEGELRGSIICPDSSVIYTEICQNNKWIPTNYKCEDEEEEEPEPEPDPDINWFTYALVIVAALSFYFLATRGSS